ncbi:uncharacterized protein LOC118147286 [Callithrix jacchus]
MGQCQAILSPTWAQSKKDRQPMSPPGHLQSSYLCPYLCETVMPMICNSDFLRSTLVSSFLSDLWPALPLQRLTAIAPQPSSDWMSGFFFPSDPEFRRAFSEVLLPLQLLLLLLEECFEVLFILQEPLLLGFLHPLTVHCTQSIQQFKDLTGTKPGEHQNTLTATAHSHPRHHG